jgi:hypothetical protein
MATTETLYTDADVQISAHRNLLIVAFSDAPAAEHLRECGRIARVLTRKYPGGIGLLDLVLSGTPRFSNEMRDEAVKLSRDPALFRQGVADVVLIPGLIGVATRSFLSTVSLLSRSPNPRSAFGTLEAADAWLVPRLSDAGERWTKGDLVAVTQPIVVARRRVGA